MAEAPIPFRPRPPAAPAPKPVSLPALIAMNDIVLERAALLAGTAVLAVTPRERMVQGIAQQLLALEDFYAESGGLEG